jgi:hypothetical protein
MHLYGCVQFTIMSILYMIKCPKDHTAIQHDNLLLLWTSQQVILLYFPLIYRREENQGFTRKSLPKDMARIQTHELPHHTDILLTKLHVKFVSVTTTWNHCFVVTEVNSGKVYWVVVVIWLNLLLQNSNYMYLDRSVTENTSRNPSPLRMYCSLIALNSFKHNNMI